jgi:hypothetical protein
MTILELFTLILATPAFSDLQTNLSRTKPDFPSTEIRWFMFHGEHSPTIRFTVPDGDTTQPIYDGTLRRYDVHVAKMFEVTHFLCQQKDIQWIDWFYKAANGKVNMGRFKIKCNLAEDIALAYGLDQFEQTTIRREFEGDASNGYKTQILSTQYLIRELNLKGNKTSQWVDFVQKFRPDYTHALANSQVPIQQILEPLKGKIPVPVFLPDYWSSSGAVYVSLEARKDGYSAYFTGVIGGTGTASYVGSVSAYKNDELMARYSSFRSQFKNVQLLNGTAGVAFSACGSTCIAVVQWENQGVVYEVHGKRSIAKLIEVANNAIAAGVRPLPIDEVEPSVQH